MVLLVVELLLIPLREISYPLYRVPMYFGYVRIVAYSIIAASFRIHRLPAYLAVVIFVCAYFALVVITRNGGEFSSVLLGVP